MKIVVQVKILFYRSKLENRFPHTNLQDLAQRLKVLINMPQVLCIRVRKQDGEP